jgi:hypothetical protein
MINSKKLLYAMACRGCKGKRGKERRSGRGGIGRLSTGSGDVEVRDARCKMRFVPQHILWSVVNAFGFFRLSS